MSRGNSNKIALFIDVPNLYTTVRSLGFDINYKRLLKEFQSRGNLLRAFYYTTVLEDQEFMSFRPLIDWLDYNGFTVITKPVKQFDDGDGRRKIRSNMSVELTVDAMELAERCRSDRLIFRRWKFPLVVAALQRRDIRVTVVSTVSRQGSVIADELRRQTDVFIDLVDLKATLGREPALVPDE